MPPIIVKLCGKEYCPKVKEFINEQWEKNHILVRNKELFDWLYYDKNNNRYNFVIGIEKKTGNIVGILGFIPLNHFDDELSTDIDIWLALWKIKKDFSSYGLQLLHYLKKKYLPNTISVLGINEGVMHLYKLLKYQVGYLKHYFMVNEKKQHFELLKNYKKNYRIHRRFTISGKKLIKVRDNNFNNIVNRINFKQKQHLVPKKSQNYFENRYLKHPFYNYQLYAITHRDNYLALIIIKIDKFKESKALRFIDCFGDFSSLQGSYHLFQKLLFEYDAEYIDCYNFGIEESEFNSIGFELHNDWASTIIPNFFEPFIKKNVRIGYAFKMFNINSNFRFQIFKGDGDQDRPNLL